MINTSDVLEIRVHLEDGHVSRFVQSDPVIALKILEAINPNRLFTSPQLLIGSDYVLIAFQPRLVVRVDMITDLNPNWPLSANALNTREITQEEFETRCNPNREFQRLPSQERVAFGVCEMVNGDRVFLQTHKTGPQRQKLPLDAGILIQQVMTSDGLLARGRESGYIVLNPARMLRFTSYVGLQEMPANALAMRRLPD